MKRGRKREQLAGVSSDVTDSGEGAGFDFDRTQDDSGLRAGSYGRRKGVVGRRREPGIN